MIEKYFHQTGKMFLHYVKRDWLKLTLWFTGLMLLSSAFADPMNAVYKNDATGLAGLFETMKSPAMLAIAGPSGATNASEYTIGAMYAQKMLLFMTLLYAILAIIHVINHTRKEEDDGQVELIRSFQVGRLSNSAAIILEMLLFHFVLGVANTLVLQVEQVPSMTDFQANFLFSFALSTQGFLWATLALIFAQIGENAARAKGVSFVLLAIFYVARMATDMRNVALSWWNPLSWSYLVSPFVQNLWRPIFLTLLFAILVLSIAFKLETIRDMNAGFLAERQGKAQAKESLLSPFGFVLRTTRSFIFWWSTSLLLLGATYGSIFGDMDKFIKGNKVLEELFLHNAKFTIQEQFMGILFMIMAIFSAVFAVGLLMKLLTEEKKCYLEQIYATKQSRTTFYFLYLGFALFFGSLGQFFASLGLYLGEATSMKQPISFATVLSSGMIYLPFIFFLIGLLAVSIGIAPRLSVLSWGYLIYAFFVAYLGDMLKLPQFLKDINVLGHIPALPIDPINWTNISIIFLVSIACMILGLIGYRRRDLISE